MCLLLSLLDSHSWYSSTSVSSISFKDQNNTICCGWYRDFFPKYDIFYMTSKSNLYINLRKAWFCIMLSPYIIIFLLVLLTIMPTYLVRTLWFFSVVYTCRWIMIVELQIIFLTFCFISLCCLHRKKAISLCNNAMDTSKVIS